MREPPLLMRKPPLSSKLALELNPNAPITVTLRDQLTNLAPFSRPAWWADALNLQIIICHTCATILTGLRSTWVTSVAQLLQDLLQGPVQLCLLLLTALCSAVQDTLDGLLCHPVWSKHCGICDSLLKK